MRVPLLVCISLSLFHYQSVLARKIRAWALEKPVSHPFSLVLFLTSISPYDFCVCWECKLHSEIFYYNKKLNYVALEYSCMCHLIYAFSTYSLTSYDLYAFPSCRHNIQIYILAIRSTYKWDNKIKLRILDLNPDCLVVLCHHHPNYRFFSYTPPFLLSKILSPAKTFKTNLPKS